MGNKLAILMAVYNGEDFLKEQIDSILKQSYREFDLLIRDDGSQDGSCQIIADYCLLDSRITWIKQESPVHSAIHNFSILFDYAKEQYDYIMFSDQDDIWHEDKIRKELRAASAYSDTAVLVYSNFELWKYKRNLCRPMYTKNIEVSFEQCTVQNAMYGCTMLLNKKMIEMVDTIPAGLDNHDHWIALVAALNRVKILYLPECLLLHRLHEKNVTGRADVRTAAGRLCAVLKGPLSGRSESRFIMWKKMYKELSSRFNDYNKLDKLKKLYHAKGLYDALKMVHIGFKGLSARGTFYFMLFIIFR